LINIFLILFLNIFDRSTYRLRIINGAAFAHMHFSIDNHNLTIIEADGIDTDALEVKSFLINVAQRYLFIFKSLSPFSFSLSLSLLSLSPPLLSLSLSLSGCSFIKVF
jgi:Multicopper oxidase